MSTEPVSNVEGEVADIVVEAQRFAEDMGAAMVMVMPPYHGATFRVAEPSIFEFYRVISDAVRIPIMIQDAPVAGTPLSVDFLARTAKELVNIRYFKIEVPMAAAKLRGLIAAGGAERGLERCEHDARGWQH